MLTRRRFIAISAALAPSLAMAERAPLHIETGLALGAKVTLRLQHPEAPRLAALAMTEIRRLENIFSLYLPDSSLSRLNRDGQLAAPPFELLECLGLASAVHAASGGRFDPTVQPLWQAEARAREAGRPLSDADRTAAQKVLGWPSVSMGPEAITLRPGMALTLNGIAQGYIADRVAGLLSKEGLTRALIDTGEMVALPEGDWPVSLAGEGHLSLRNQSLASSAPLGMTFGGDGVTSHILDPRTARPVVSSWRTVSISAPTAALADALSTAVCLAEDEGVAQEMVRSFPSARIEQILPARAA